jgi:cytochrome c
MWRRTHIFKRNGLFLNVCLLLATFYLFACHDEPEQKNTRKTIDYIRPIPGKNDPIPAAIAEKGKVLIAYSDCYTCHKEEERSVAPAFKDIAKRYPVNKVYIEMLAHKVIIGGSGSWGSPVMDPHLKLSFEDAKIMVTYILSMKE